MTHSRRRAGVFAVLGCVVASSTAALVWGEPWQAHLVCMLAAFASFAALMVLQARGSLLGRRLVLVVSGLLLTLAVVFPPRESTDVWAYAMYGRVVAVHHASPYRNVPSAYPDDPWLQRMWPRWRSMESVYGPVFTGVSAGIMRAAGDSPTGARVGFQGLAAIATFAMLILIDRRLKDPGATAVLGLNPVVVVSIVNSAHNDILVGLAVLVAVLAVMRDRSVLAGVALALGALVKASTLLLGLAVLAWMFRRRGVRRALVAGTSAAVVGIAGLGLAGGTSVIRPLLDASGRTMFSIWDLPRRWKVLVGSPAARFTSTPGWAIALVVVVALLVIARHARGHTPVVAVGAGALVYLVGAPLLVPWYIAWSLPVLAMEWRSRLTLLTLAQGALLVVGYLVFQAGPIYGVPSGIFKVFMVSLCLWEAVVVLLLVRGAIRQRGSGPAGPTPSVVRGGAA